MSNRYFVLAHGVGMTGEYPYLQHLEDFAQGYDGVLKAGMTLCVESYTRKGHNLTFLPEVTQLESARREYTSANTAM